MRYLGGKALLHAGMVASAIAVSAAAGGFMAKPAEARVFVGVGIGVGPYCCGYSYPYPYPYAYPYAYPYSYGYPTYVAPPAVVQQVAPVQNTSAPVWYFCDNPQGYYPYVQNCSVSWRAVAPNQAPQKQPDPSSASSPGAQPPAGAVVQ